MNPAFKEEGIDGLYLNFLGLAVEIDSCKNQTSKGKL